MKFNTFCMFNVVLCGVIGLANLFAGNTLLGVLFIGLEILNGLMMD